ncbi:hypothetical protein ECZU06_60620 [Escherichia coli]|nr:hypothetical protein ECZU06_60620 [Escherichia coli]
MKVNCCSLKARPFISVPSATRHCLNGYAAAQGVMVWLPDLHPASVVALNARALKEIFSDERKRIRQGRAVLNALVQNRLAVEEKFRTASGGFC